MENSLKVRFAPSPTGFLHIGSARTALFNWIFAKKHNARFVLRVEDTDINRSRKEFLDEILDSLQWLGMRWDELYYQSKRFDIYQSHAQKLVREGKAFCEGNAVIFKYEFQKIVFDDMIRGHIEFSELPKATEVIIKSDGTPTYNFACCIDDALLGITHVIRGEDHISNTPKQILLFQALGFELPRFAHLPMILSPEGGKLSKRFGATAIRDYRQEGYLAQALTNYLLLLGWSPGNNNEILPFDNAVALFEIKNINKTSAAFSLEKLQWVNSAYLKNIALDDLVSLVNCYFKEKNFALGISKEYLADVIKLFQGRISTLGDLVTWGYFCFYDDYPYGEDTASVLEKDLSSQVLSLRQRLEELEHFDHACIEQEFRNAASDLGLKARDLVHPVRVALTGKRIGPGLFETMEVLGKEAVSQRLNRLIAYWRKEGSCEK